MIEIQQIMMTPGFYVAAGAYLLLVLVNFFILIRNSKLKVRIDAAEAAIARLEALEERRSVATARMIDVAPLVTYKVRADAS